MEIVIAIAIFSVLAIAAATMAIDSLHTAGDNRERVRAANLAAEEVERVRAQFNVARGGVNSNCLTRAAEVDFGDGRYTLACTATWLDASRVAGPRRLTVHRRHRVDPAGRREGRLAEHGRRQAGHQLHPPVVMRALRTGANGRRAKAKNGDAGFSLVEIVVGISLFTVVIGLLGTFAINMIRSNEGTRGRLTNVDQLRVAMDSVTKELRTAVRPEQLNPACTTAPCEAAFTSATGAAVTFFANHGVTGGKANLTTFLVEQNPGKLGTGRFVEQVRPAAVPVAAPSTACGTGCVTRVLSTGLTWPVVTPVFTFADQGCTTFGTAPDLADISCVAVDLPVAGGRDYAGTSARSTVFLPNSVMGP